MVRALALADTSAVMSIDFLRLIWGSCIGYFIFADLIHASTWIGGVLIVVSGIYIIFRESRTDNDNKMKQPDDNPTNH
jgi:drug/metabolite transporter (DMT)-like permease